MSAPKPTIVFVAGAFSNFDGYTPTTSILKQEGYEVIPVTLPSVGANPPHADFSAEVSAIRDAAMAPMNAGKDVVLVVHSWAGVPGSEAMKGLSKSDRESNGLKGGVVRLVYLTAAVLEVGLNGQSVAEGEPFPWMRLEPDKRVYVRDPETLMFGDLDPATRKAMAEKLESHSWGSFITETTHAAWREVPSTYLICENDNCLPAFVQELMTNTPGSLFEVERCSAGHFPTLSMPKFTADVIRRAAGE
ncbi:alpha/beta-hydrolase, partial [Lophium mytilinum]